MTNLRHAIWAEFLKARRSRVPFFTAVGFSLAPLMGGFFMVILKDPAAAQRIGILRTKAELIAGRADWPTYFGLLAQATAVGGILLFALITSWVFGREYSDGTAKDLMALPTPRSAIVTAKFVVVGVWSLLLTVMIGVLGLAVGWLVEMPGWSIEEMAAGGLRMLTCAVLTAALMTPIAFAASAGEGYLAPMGFAIILLVVAQVVGAAGWGSIFPWSIPATYAGMGGRDGIGVESTMIVLVTSGLGLAGTFGWWKRADQKK